MSKLGLFLNFDGNCADVLEFYAKAFETNHGMIMRYADTPGGNQVPGYDDKIMYADMIIGGENVMFSDAPPQGNYVAGNNICLNYSSNDTASLQRIFDALAEGGAVLMPMQKTFFSELYGMVEDKFGIFWNIMV
ncbi:MAG: VOC family protein [Defluviitaleaceae bacterium]|nr:VOC family protein [Defluviitaleaceae bacterium]